MSCSSCTFHDHLGNPMFVEKLRVRRESRVPVKTFAELPAESNDRISIGSDRGS